MNVLRKTQSTVCLTPDVALPVITYRNQPVITLAMIDKVHQRPEETAGRNFRAHRDKLIEGEDYFKVCADEIRRRNILPLSSKAHEAILLFAETGYLMLVKSFQDDLAWKIQRQLVKTYFRAIKGDVTLADEIADRASLKDQQWLAARMQGKVKRRALTDTLQEHGVKHWGYARCTNALYKGALGGDKPALCARKGLPSHNKNLREVMSLDELITTQMAELVARVQIEKRDLHGNAPCAAECEQSGQKVAALLR